MGENERPIEWDDDRTMDVLFSPFRESREVNPASWDKKIKFWSELLLDHCRNSGTVAIKTNEIAFCFERKGKRPVCLNKVIEELMRKRKLQSYEEFCTDSGSTWLKWGIHWAVKKPAAWTLNTFVKKPLSWTYNKLLGSEDNSNSPITLIVTEVVQERAELLLQNHHNSVTNETTDCVIGYTDLFIKNKHIFKDEYNFDVTLLQLVKTNKCIVFETENHLKVIRFVKTDKRSVTPPSECDNQIYKLKTTEVALLEQIENLSKEIERLREDAKVFLKRGMKPTALNTLRKKKKIEAVRSQKENSLVNIQQLMISIQQTDSNKMVLDAYNSGNEAFKQLSKDYGLTPDTIDDIMTDMEETFDMQDDINRSISQNPSSTFDPSLAELELELSDILSEGNDSSGFFGGGLPEVPTHEPEPVGFTSFSPERDDDLNLELPDVPKFSPERPAAESLQKSAFL